MGESTNESRDIFLFSLPEGGHADDEPDDQ